MKLPRVSHFSMTHQHWSSFSRVELQQASQFGDVETYHDVSVNHCHRRCHIPEFFQFIESGFVGSNVSIHELHVVL